jgi:uracil-DNA glycosylase
MSLAALVPQAWRPALANVSLAPLEALLLAEPGVVLPPREQIFAALAHVAPDDVKAVIVGQDPYPTPGNANGLAFSVSPGVKVPASLRNVFAALEDEGWPRPTSGDLTPWARAGVLLLNTVLTVRAGEAASHKKRGWEPITTALLRRVNESPGPVVFLALGKPAQAMADALVDRSHHVVLSLPHPSPLNGKAFVVAAKAMKPFTRTNELLVAGGRTPIDWTLR